MKNFVKNFIKPELEFNARDLRDCFGLFATGVMIATTTTKHNLHGLTINSFSSVSLEPPLLLFSIDNNSSNLKVFKKSKRFCLNILSKNQEELAKEFAKPSNGEKWTIEKYNLTIYNNPVFENSVAFFECENYKMIKAGDHHILIGRIINFAKMNDDECLFYHLGKFC